nr:transposase [Rhodothermus marinus]MBO2492353.1 transposase [Rhodothermus marinus]
LGGVVNRPEVALASVLTVLHGQNRNGSKSSYKPMTSVVGS